MRRTLLVWLLVALGLVACTRHPGRFGAPLAPGPPPGPASTIGAPQPGLFQ